MRNVAGALRSLLEEVLPCQTGGEVAHQIGVTIMVVRGNKTTMTSGGPINSERVLSDFQDQTRRGVFEDIIQYGVLKDIVCPIYKSQGRNTRHCLSNLQITGLRT